MRPSTTATEAALTTAFTTLVTAILLFASACSRDEPAPRATDGPKAANRSDWLSEAIDESAYRDACDDFVGCGEIRFPAPGPAETVWRVQVVREPSGSVRIASIDSVDVPEGDGVPIGPVSGEYLLAGLDGAGNPIDGQMIRFPDTLRIEFENAESLPQELDLTDKGVDTIAFVRALPDIVSLAVLDKTDTVHASAQLPSKPASDLSYQPSMGLGLITPAYAATHPWNGLPPYCSHVLVLNGEADRDLAEGIAYEEQLLRLVQPGPLQLAMTRTALGWMTPLLCQSVRRIAFGYVAQENTAAAVSQAGTADMMIVNVAGNSDEDSLSESRFQRVYLVQTILHEAGHSAEALLNAESANPDYYSGSWGFPARTLANKTIDRVRLERGLVKEWRRVHDSFVSLGWASDYQTKATAYQWSTPETVNSGFMSHYGATGLADDIAEFVALAYMSEVWAGESSAPSNSRDFGCLEMQAHGRRDLPANLSAAYAKLLFLRDLGLVSPRDVEFCRGDNLRIPVETEGFHVWQGTMRLRSFENHVKAVIGTERLGNRVFEMTAAGEAEFGGKMYPTTVRLRLDLESTFEDLNKVSWPRGAYQLGLMGDNNLQLRLDGAHAGNFDAMDGFAVVVESSNDRIAGSVVLQRVMRLQAPLPVPERYDPPLIFRFLIEN